LTKPDYKDELSHPSSLLRRKRFEEKYIKDFDEKIKLEINYLDEFMNLVYHYLEQIKSKL
jgi:hypothetical protein